MQRCLFWALPLALTSVLLTTMTLSGAPAEQNKNPNPKILPVKADAFGQSYGAWSAAWWQWSLSIPADHNPSLDATGADAAQGQSGHVWFLAGIFGAGGSVERTVTIPAGKALFLPIYNVVEINAPQLGDPPWSAARELELRQLAADSIESVTDLSADIDGRPVVDLASYRVQDDGPFNVDLPDNNVFDVPADTYGPSVSDGYFLMLAPLPAGKHTIHFSSTAGGVTQEVTYYLSVK